MRLSIKTSGIRFQNKGSLNEDRYLNNKNDFIIFVFVLGKDLNSKTFLVNWKVIQ